MRKAIHAIAAAGFLCGCSMINPYQSEFSCPDTFKGKCASLREVYLEDASGRETADKATPKHDCTATSSDGEEHPVTTCGSGSPSSAGTGLAAVPPSSATESGSPEETSFNRYRTSLYDRFSSLLKEPRTPVVAPPKVMRVLLLPYTGQENEFYMLRYVYFFVDKPRWVLGDSVVADGEEE